MTSLGLTDAQAQSVADELSDSSGAGQGQGAESLPPALREQVFAAIQNDYAEATQLVFYGMVIALVVALGFALFHPGGKVTAENLTAEDEVPVSRS